MFKTAAIITFATWMAIPASANPTVELMERKLAVQPGVYTLNELVQIQDAGRDAAVRIELIDLQKAAFRRVVEETIRGTGMLSTANMPAQ